jgi:hypothetical protein
MRDVLRALQPLGYDTAVLDVEHATLSRCFLLARAEALR